MAGPDASVVRALEAALAADPSDLGVRAHLAEVLLNGGEAAMALEHLQRLLIVEPDNSSYLGLADRAATADGQLDLALRYRRLLRVAAPATPEVSGREALAAGEQIEGEAAIDQFLAEVLGGDPDLERPTVRLADVGGLKEVKARLETSFLGPMRNPELRRMYGKSLRGGLLLYGPPGCGKTFLARAVAGELGANFFSVGLHEILDMWLGQSEQNLHKVFELARRSAPCVLFLDEVDALGQKRSNLSHSAGRNVVVQLLTELDSTRDDNEGVFVLGATNQPWETDAALRRPGRFDRQLLVLPPDVAAREAIVELHLRERPTQGVAVAKIAKATEGYSGADLRLVCEAAAERALSDSISSGNARPIGQRDLEAAVAEVRPSTRPWFDVARNYATFANQSGEYDELLLYMRKQRWL